MKSDLDRELFDADEFRVQFERPETIRRLIKIFPEEMGEYLDRARAALAKNDARELHQAAHGLKGAVGNYLGTRAYAAATELDHLARTRNLSAAPEALKKCEEEVKALGEALRNFEAEEIDAEGI